MQNRWIILAVLFLARIAMGFQFQSVATTAALLVQGLRIDYARIGTLIGLYMLPGVVIAIPGGLVGQRFGDKVVCVSGLLLMLAGGSIMGSSASYAPALCGRLVSGTGAVIFNLVLTKMVADWFAGREIVLAMGVILASWPCGIAVALLVQPLIAEAAGWPSVMYAAAGLCAAAMALVAGLYAPPRRPETVRTSAATPSVMGLPPLPTTITVIVAGIMWGSFNLGLILYFSFTTPLLVEHGMPTVGAASLTSLALWISMLSLPLGGYAVQRCGYRTAAVVIFTCVAGAAMMLLAAGLWPAALCLAVGLAIGPPAGAIMALPSRVLDASNRASGFGVFYAAYYFATALGPALAGSLRDHWQTASAPILMGGAAFVGTVLLLPVFHGLAARQEVRPILRQAGVK